MRRLREDVAVSWKNRSDLVQLVDEHLNVLNVRDIDMAPEGMVAENILEALEDFLRSDGTFPPKVRDRFDPAE